MSIANIKFFINEALVNLKRAGAMTFVTISTISISLLLMGNFLFATINMESFLSQLQAQALITVYLNQNATADDAKNLKLKLISDDNIAKIDLITPQEAARELFSNPNDQELLQIGISDTSNPLPYTLRIKIKNTAQLKKLVERIKNESYVDDVSYGKDLFEQFQGMSRLLWIGSLIVILFLGAASLFIVYNTIRLTLYMRREEIIIMKLVGATNWFIRGPFIIEGFIHGVLGAFIAIILLFASYKLIFDQLVHFIPFFKANISTGQFIKLSIKLFMMGIILGISGSLFSLRDISTFSKTPTNNGF